MSTFKAHRSRPSTTQVTKPRHVDDISDEDNVPTPARSKFMEIVRSCRYTPNQFVINPCSSNTSGSPSNKRKAINDLKEEGALVSKKRQRRKKAAKPKKQPKIQSLPVEILLQVFMYVQLQDLLYLSRSCKWLRVILTAHSNRPTWVDVMRAAAMPECPMDMCEIAYAHLIYDRICHMCYKNKASQENIMCRLRVRVCQQCVEQYHPDLVNLSISDVYSSHPLLHRGRLMSAKVLPSEVQWYGTGSSHRLYLRKDCDELHAYMSTLTINSPEWKMEVNRRRLALQERDHWAARCGSWIQIAQLKK